MHHLMEVNNNDDDERQGIHFSQPHEMKRKVVHFMGVGLNHCVGLS